MINTDILNNMMNLITLSSLRPATPIKVLIILALVFIPLSACQDDTTATDDTSEEVADEKETNNNDDSSGDDDKDDKDGNSSGSSQFETGDVTSVFDEGTTYAVYNYKASKWTLKSGYESQKDDLSKMHTVFTDIITPTYVANYLTDWYVYEGDNLQTLGFVQMQEERQDWIMAIYDDTFKNLTDLTGGYRELVYTYVHEFFHIYGLNVNQLSDALEGECGTLFHPEGCANAEAYILSFYNQFWKNKESPNTGSDFTDEQKKRFVTQYATTNHVEDLAESFTFFVFRERPTSTTLIRDQKIDFFYNYPEIVKVREDFRKNFSKYELEDDRLPNYSGKNKHTHMLYHR